MPKKGEVKAVKEALTTEESQELIEQMKKKPEPPKFNHKEAASLVFGDQGKWLLQHGHHFSYAEYDREKEKYVPDPIYVNRDKLSSDQLKATLLKTITKMQSLEDLLKDLQKDFLLNVEMFNG